MTEARPSINPLGYRANFLDFLKALDWRHQDNFHVITHNSSFFIVDVEHVTVRLVKLFRDFVLMKLFFGVTNSIKHLIQKVLKGRSMLISLYVTIQLN